LDAGVLSQVPIMAVIKRSNSKNWYIQFQLNGMTYIRSAKTTNKKAAVQMEAEWRTQLHANAFLGKKERIRLGEAIDRLCMSRIGTPSYKGMLSCAKVVSSYLPGGKYIDELKSHDLERFRQQRSAAGISNQTILHNLNLVRGAWKFASKLGYQVSELEFPQLKIAKPPVRFLSDAEEGNLLVRLDPRREGPGLAQLNERSESIQQMLQDSYDLAVLLLDTGGRYSEIANIEWTRIDMQARTINLWRTKVSNGLILHMTDRVYQILLRRQGNGVYVFQNKAGEARGYSTHSIRNAIKRAGLDGCRVHSFRHTLATRLLRSGMSLYEVKEILGHTKIETTMIYAHLELSETSVKARDLLNDLNRTLIDRKHSTFCGETQKALQPMFSFVQEEKDDLLLTEVQS
jgi:integrase